MWQGRICAVALASCACSLDSTGGGAASEGASASGTGTVSQTETASETAETVADATGVGAGGPGSETTGGAEATTFVSATQTSPTTSEATSAGDETSTGRGSTGAASSTETGCTQNVWYLDEDSDGAGDPEDSIEACEAPPGYVDDDSDCDDANMSIHPGASETCDNEDNDCDGKLDEHSVDNTSCNGCTSLEERGIAYYFCPGAIDWFDAAAGCEAFGATLASVHGVTENDLIRNGCDDAGIGEGWLGMNDEDVEGQWVWVDGTAFDYVNWVGGGPDNAGDGGEQCGEQEADGRWQDVPCDQLNDGYACKDPDF